LVVKKVNLQFLTSRIALEKIEEGSQQVIGDNEMQCMFCSLVFKAGKLKIGTLKILKGYWVLPSHRSSGGFETIYEEIW
jgi:hypothetical protein